MNHSPTPTPGAIPHVRLSIDRRVQLLGRRGCTIWLTGLPASGKSTIALLIEEKLLTEKRPALILTATRFDMGSTQVLDLMRVAVLKLFVERENLR